LTIINPCELLPPQFEGIDDDETAHFIMNRNIQEGGAVLPPWNSGKLHSLNKQMNFVCLTGTVLFF